jgi:hypothetical protein
MKTQTQDTSKEALRELRNNKIEGRRLQVYNCIKNMGECSNSMIAQELRLSINKITGRVNELRNNFKVVGFAKKDMCPVTNRMVLFWKVVKDFDKFEDRESNIFNNVVGRCYKCGCLNCECGLL